MISIGITICDKDFHNLDFLLQQIKEKIKCSYEIIIIDNREQLKEEKTAWQPTFQFGYNAYQFTARAKIIELAKGDYIWFIDGDDEIADVTNFNYKEDIIVFSYNDYPNGDHYYNEQVLKENFINYDIFREIGPTLWNKFIKKSLFSKSFIEKYKSKTIVHNEDSIWLYEALIHAKTIRESNNLVYYHKEGYSNKIGKISYEDLVHLTTGLKESIEILSEIPNKDISENIIKNTYAYLGTFISNNTDLEKSLKLLMDLIPKDDFKEVLQTNIYSECQSYRQMQKVIDIVKERYGEEFPFKKSVCKVTYEDGHIEDYEFTNTIEFDNIEETPNGTWNHTLSIICLVYDGNKQFLAKCTSMINDNVQVPHEVIIVDNRDDKSDKLNYIGDAKIVEAKKNIGILDGRRLGFEAATSDYIWFVDIDDYILPIDNNNYGDNDIIIFPYCFNGTHTYNRIGVFENTEFFTESLYCIINPFFWNKWIKREILKKAYKDIPHFFCIYNEDNIVTFTAFKYAKYAEIFETSPIYTHVVNKSSTTTKQIVDEKSIDKLFIGFDQASQYFLTNFEFCKDLTYKPRHVINFYLDVMNNADDIVLEYFANKLVSLFGQDRVIRAIEYMKQIEESAYSRIEKYFYKNNS